METVARLGTFRKWLVHAVFLRTGSRGGAMGKTPLVRRIPSAGIVLAVLAAAVLAGCGSGGGSTGAAPSAGSPVAKQTGRATVTLKVPERMEGGELSSPHQLEVPEGW